MVHPEDLYAERHDLELSWFGKAVLSLLLRVFEGRPPREIRASNFSNEDYISVRLYRDSELCNQGSAKLTALVLLATDKGLRFSLSPGSSDSIRLVFQPGPKEDEMPVDIDDFIEELRAE